MVTPFAQCIARPPEEGRPRLLVEHLTAVAAGCGSRDGDPAERLGHLAGLLHDAGKATTGWQRYIREGKGKGPPHAPLGAALFAYCAAPLVGVWAEGNRAAREALEDLVLDWTRAVYDHHGVLENLEDLPPWEATAHPITVRDLVGDLDLAGALRLVADAFAGFSGTAEDCRDWLDRCERDWARAKKLTRARVLERDLGRAPAALAVAGRGLRLAGLSARLVRADRGDAGQMSRLPLLQELALEAGEALVTTCREKAAAALGEGANAALVGARGELQAAAVARYRRHPGASLFTLLLPTGYGKTLAALRVALAAVAAGRCDRIIYVAPYLSILSQAAREIASATGLEVFEHHHLTVASEAADVADEMGPLDNWEAPVLATTFNQLFRALFPRRAQHTLRLGALDRAFIIVDEPQIIDSAVWAAFVRALAALCELRSCQVLFATATLPPIAPAAGAEPVHLAGELPPARPGRYRVLPRSVPFAAREVAEAVRLARGGDGAVSGPPRSVAVVMNTIADAVAVWRAVEESIDDGDGERFFLSAMMLPGHKALTIAQIAAALKAGSGPIAICTQVIEAGVDLSFDEILRASTILPSVAQVAGRANRHGEKQRARVTVFPFVRGDGKDSRPYVYRDAVTREETDALLGASPELQEEEMGEALARYYDRVWQRSQGTACLERFREAARGNWKELGGLQPYSDGPPRRELLVPREAEGMSAAMCRLRERFAPEGVDQLIDRVQNPRFLKRLAFADRKRLWALVRQYCVAVPERIARDQGAALTEWLAVLKDLKDYDERLGMAIHFAENVEEASCTIF